MDKQFVRLTTTGVRIFAFTYLSVTLASCFFSLWFLTALVVVSLFVIANLDIVGVLKLFLSLGG